MTTATVTATRPASSEVALPKGAQQFLLPKLAATGRLARIEPPEVMQPDPENLRPLAWDDGPPWRFRLDIARDDQRQQWALSGQLHRESGECLPLATARTIFKQGIVVFEDRIALMETAGVDADDRGPAKDAARRSSLQGPLGAGAAAVAIARGRRK